VNLSIDLEEKNLGPVETFDLGFLLLTIF